MKKPSALQKFSYSVLWVIVTVAVLSAGMTSLVFDPDSAWKGQTNVLVFWLSLFVALIGLGLQARHDFYSFCFGSFFYSLITAVITGAVALIGKGSHPIAAGVAIITGAVTVFCVVYMLRNRPGYGTSSSVYDKAKYHFDSVAEHSLPVEQAYVHTGMLWAWFVESGFHDEWFGEDYCDAETDIATRSRTGPYVFEADCDGVLDDRMLNEEGNAFAQWYVNGQQAKFWSDYEEVLCEGLPSIFHVDDTWENYELLRGRIDQRLKEWQQLGTPAGR